MSNKDLSKCKEIQVGDTIRAIVISIDAIEDRQRGPKHSEKERDFLRINLALYKSYEWEIEALYEIHPNIKKQVENGHFKIEPKWDFPEFALPQGNKNGNY